MKPRVLLISLGLWILGGCAQAPVEPGAPGRTDLVTESDQTPERKRASIRLELAVGYFEQGKTTVALDEVKQALQADPAYAEAYSLRGLIYMRLNDFALAEESFQTALRLSPGNSGVLHNMGWLLCQQARYPQADALFVQALANPLYGERAKTYMTQGLCHMRAGLLEPAQASLLKSYEYDSANPVTGYNLSSVLYQRQEYVRAQFYIRRLNNSDLANAETLWLGVKVERRMGNPQAMNQLGSQLLKRFPQAPQAALYQRGQFDE